MIKLNFFKHKLKTLKKHKVDKIQYSMFEQSIMNKVLLHKRSDTIIYYAKKLKNISNKKLNPLVVDKLLSSYKQMNQQQRLDVLIVIEGSLIEKHFPFISSTIQTSNCKRVEEECFLRLDEFEQTEQKSSLIAQLSYCSQSTFIRRTCLRQAK